MHLPTVIELTSDQLNHICGGFAIQLPGYQPIPMPAPMPGPVIVPDDKTEAPIVVDITVTPMV